MLIKIFKIWYKWFIYLKEIFQVINSISLFLKRLVLYKFIFVNFNNLRGLEHTDAMVDFVIFHLDWLLLNKFQHLSNNFIAFQSNSSHWTILYIKYMD